MTRMGAAVAGREGSADGIIEKMVRQTRLTTKDTNHTKTDRPKIRQKNRGQKNDGRINRRQQRKQRISILLCYLCLLLFKLFVFSSVVHRCLIRGSDPNTRQTLFTA